MSEEELASKFVKHFVDVDMYFEVPHLGNTIDIVTKNGLVISSVEVKTTFNFKVLEQATRNLNYFNFSWIAVPYSRNRSGFAHKYCKEKGIGLLQYNKKKDSVWITLRAKFNRPRKGIKSEVKLFDYMKENSPGVVNDRITPFKNTINEIDSYIKKYGDGVCIKKVLNGVNHHYSTINSGKYSIIAMCKGDNPVIKEFIVKEGKVFKSSSSSNQ